MKKSGSDTPKEITEKELKRLRKDNSKLKTQKEADMARIKELKKELKKRRADNNNLKRTTQVAFEPVPGHRFSIQMIMLCLLISVRAGCGLRTVISIIGIFEEVMGEALGQLPCYNSVANWVHKLGLSVYEEDAPQGRRYTHIIDESIMVNKEKLLLVLGIPAEHDGKPQRHGDVTVLASMSENASNLKMRLTRPARKPEVGQNTGSLMESIIWRPVLRTRDCPTILTSATHWQLHEACLR